MIKSTKPKEFKKIDFNFGETSINDISAHFNVSRQTAAVWKENSKVPVYRAQLLVNFILTKKITIAFKGEDADKLFP